jgi:hypothetical protein
VCKGRQMTETVWLTAARAWNMPVSRLSADAATRLGLTERPNDCCQVRPCNAAGAAAGWIPRQDRERVRDRPSGVSDGKEAAGDELPQTRDWETVERFLCNVVLDKMAGLRETHKYHVRIVLQSERDGI